MGLMICKKPKREKRKRQFILCGMKPRPRKFQVFLCQFNDGGFHVGACSIRMTHDDKCKDSWGFGEGPRCGLPGHHKRSWCNLGCQKILLWLGVTLLSLGWIGHIWALFLDFHLGCIGSPGLVIFWILFINESLICARVKQNVRIVCAVWWKYSHNAKQIVKLLAKLWLVRNA